jgi:hypothetical protein
MQWAHTSDTHFTGVGIPGAIHFKVSDDESDSAGHSNAFVFFADYQMVGKCNNVDKTETKPTTVASWHGHDYNVWKWDGERVICVMSLCV